MESVTTFAVIGGAVLTLAGLVTLGWKGYRFADRLFKLVHHEMNHNGGESMKDHTRKAAVESAITNVLVKEVLDQIKDVKSEVAKAKNELREFSNDQLAWNGSIEKELDRAWLLIGGKNEQARTGER